MAQHLLNNLQLASKCDAIRWLFLKFYDFGISNVPFIHHSKHVHNAKCYIINWNDRSFIHFDQSYRFF